MALTPGSRLGVYEVLAPLGAGGMGEVYRARDERLGRTVAIKVISSRVAGDPDLGARLLREARAASVLNHPNIVTVHEIGEADGVDFIVMERVEGRPLGALIPPDGMPLLEALDLGGQIAGAVAAAHEAHIVHRDLKPGNIMVTPTGQVKVLDFGLARFAPPVVVEESAPTMAMPTRLTGTRTILGTVGYLSPEQIDGRSVEAPSDVFALGIILFEMVTGRRPFTGDSDWAVLAATVRGDAPRVESLKPGTPAELGRIIARCLAARPQDRYPTAVELGRDLRALASQGSAAHAIRSKRSSRFLVGAVALALVALAAMAWLLVRESRVRWARETAIAEVEKRTARGDLVGAYAIAQRALEIAPRDFRVQQAWDHAAPTRVNIESQPAGAEVAFQSYVGGDARWLPLGKTPLKLRIPLGLLRWRLTHAGYDTLVAGQGGDRLQFKLAPQGAAPAGMVLAPSGSVLWESQAEDVELPDFWIDRHEVTNRQYKAFVDAGGYEEREHWKEPFIRNGKTIPWEQAMSAFRDATGRPGPATWEFGTFPQGQEEFPVGGVSWYEAAAYAAFVGRQLPTVYHWYRASGSQGVFSEIITVSNYSAKGPAAVGSMSGLGPFGTMDMAGNVKEWCWNETKGLRYTLGGGWNELLYAFHDQDARSPFEREATFGFRCILPSEPLAAHLTAPVQSFQQDPALLKPAADDLFQAYVRLYDYDPTPLESKIESVDDASPIWKKEVVTVRAAYGSERLPLHIFIPKNARPPYQTVVLFPGSNAVRTSSSQDLRLRLSDFHVHAGRVLVYPIYQGTYERRIPGARGVNQIRDIMIQRGKDIRRTLDYLATRRDIDTTRIAFYGISLGAQLGPLFLVIEPRFRTGVLFSGGFETWRMAPECDPLHFTPRVKVSVLMVNGREDFDLPYATAQVPMFQMLGTKDKKHFVLEGGHIPLHPETAVREMVDWLDERFGPVK